jgi:hypothetical protein
MSPNTPKGIPTLGVGILKIFGNFELRFENQACSKSRPSLNHSKGLELYIYIYGELVFSILKFETQIMWPIERLKVKII